jgi:HEAT repeat protein
MTPYERLKARENSQEDRLNALVLLLQNTLFDDEWELFRTILTTEDEQPEVRCAIALGMAKVSGQEALEPLLSAVNTTNLEVKIYVMTALGRSHQEAAIPVLVEALEDSDDGVFNAAAEALGELGKVATSILIELLSSPRDDIRCMAAWQLGQHQLEKGISALIERIKLDNTMDVVALSVWALGEIGHSTPEVQEALSQAKKHPNPDVHERAQRALKKIARHIN